MPHASVSGTNDSTTDVDWYSLTGADYAEVYIDIDCGYGCGVCFNPLVAIFDDTGTMIAYDNDANPADPGSAGGQDPFIGRFFLPGSFTGSATYYVSVSNGYPNGLACSNFIQLERPDGQFGGWQVDGSPAGNDTFVAGGDSTGDYILHISNSAPPVLGPNFDNQLSDQPKYRWLDLPSPNPFQPELVAAPDYQSGAGICQMTVPSPATCSEPGAVLGLAAGGILLGCLRRRR